jgi:hypothetical protein
MVVIPEIGGIPLFKRYGTWIIGLFVVVVLSYALFSSSFPGWPKSTPGDDKVPQNTEVAKHDTKVKVTPNTEIVQKIEYTKCGEEEIVRTKVADNQVGFSLQQLQQVYQGWTIETFDTQEIILSLAVDTYCKMHNDHTFLGISKGYVAVFYGTPGPKALLKQETHIPIDSLHPQDRSELEKGMVVKDRSELLQTLEGLQEHQ